jgi:hypothetical protein
VSSALPLRGAASDDLPSGPAALATGATAEAVAEQGLTALLRAIAMDRQGFGSQAREEMQSTVYLNFSTISPKKVCKFLLIII